MVKKDRIAIVVSSIPLLFSLLLFTTGGNNDRTVGFMILVVIMRPLHNQIIFHSFFLKTIFLVFLPD
ncbi:MAG: hypothetical protein DRQ51_00460 [Gammaproteobacteria bacterium]|nr:MAG: hypothetical protein DRQ51_00460 [Gammaproteobacteria bacterium]